MYTYTLYLFSLHTFTVVQTCSLVRKAFRKGSRAESPLSASPPPQSVALLPLPCAAALRHCLSGRSCRALPKNAKTNGTKTPILLYTKSNGTKTPYILHL